MDKRIIYIYGELYMGAQKKKTLAELCDVTSKTIENTVSKYNDDIVMDRTLGAYRFKKLLPSYIPHDVFFQLFKESIASEVLKVDFAHLSQLFKQKDLEIPMIPTRGLSPLAQKIIMAEVAINTNCVVKLDYVGNYKPLETKYIKPHKVISTGATYYLYASYDKRNEENVGEYRSLAFNGMHNLQAIKYLKDDSFKVEGIGNAYGLITKEKSITLELEATSANYFKREGLFNKENYDFISEEIDGSVIMKMHYNNIQEVVKLIQSWMPMIAIKDAPEITQSVYEIITQNTKRLILDKEQRTSYETP